MFVTYMVFQKFELSFHSCTYGMSQATSKHSWPKSLKVGKNLKLVATQLNIIKLICTSDFLKF